MIQSRRDFLKNAGKLAVAAHLLCHSKRRNSGRRRRIPRFAKKKMRRGAGMRFKCFIGFSFQFLSLYFIIKNQSRGK